MSLGVRPAGGAGSAFRRDVRRLVATAGDRHGAPDALALLWTRPWDGTTSLDFTTLDPLYVEVCRRVRLRHGGDGVEALAAGSKCARVATADLKGRTGDPWAPMKADGTSSHTPSGAGFGYRQMAQLLDAGRTKQPLLAEFDDEDDPQGLSIVAAALVRGQGKTEGLHRRAVRTSRIAEVGGQSGKTVFDRVGNVARTRSDEAGEAGRRLRRALILLVQGGPVQARLDDDAAQRKVDPWMRRFDVRVDGLFFDDDFWAEAAGDVANHRLAWRERLRTIAADVFAIAAEAAPRTEMRRIRAIARAKSLLDGQMYNWVKDVVHGE